jgi:hypothetical protein
LVRKIERRLERRHFSVRDARAKRRDLDQQMVSEHQDSAGSVIDDVSPDRKDRERHHGALMRKRGAMMDCSIA